MTTRNRELASIIDDSGNITAGGNLTVSGTTLTASSTVETHADPLIELNTGAGSNANDLGFVFERGSTGDNACLIWDESNDAFAVGTTSATGTSTGNMSYTVGDFLAGKVTVDSVLINGTTIGHTSDTDLITLADGLVTVAGEISVTTLDIGGTNVSATAAELNILDGVNSTAAELNILDGVTATAAEINIIDGDTSATGTTLADADRVIVNDGGTMKQVALTDFETYFESAIDTFSTIDINGGSIDGATVGAASASTGAFTTLSASGAITGTLGTAAQTNVTSLGTLTSLNVDSLTLNGTSLTSSGNLTLDVTGDITFDADGGDFYFKDDGTTIGAFTNTSSDFCIRSRVSDKDIVFKGEDNNSEITALTLDMSEAGNAHFNQHAYYVDNGKAIFGGGSDLQIYHDASNSYIKNTVGWLNIPITQNGVSIGNSDFSESLARFLLNGACELYYDGSKTLETVTGGVTVSGATTTNVLKGGATNFDIYQTTSDGTDNRRTRIGGGGDVSQSRGAFIELTGNEHSDTGNLILNAGDVSGGEMIFKTDNAERMRILDSGNVSIGGTADDNGVLSVIANKGSAGDLWTQVGPNNNMSLILQNTSTTDNTNACLYFGNDSGVTAAINARFVDHSDEETELRFSTHDGSNARERMVLSGSGTLGIGTMAPFSTAEVHLKTASGQPAASGTTQGLAALCLEPQSNIRWDFGSYYSWANACWMQTGNGTDLSAKYAIALNPRGGASAANGGAVGIANMGAEPSATQAGFMFSADQFYTSAGAATSANTQVRFINGNGLVGNVTTSGSATAFNTSSDHRLKENVDYTWDATTRLKQLKPARFNWIVDDTNTLVDGFLAHEVSSIVPEAITGEKDGMYEPVLYKEEDNIPDGKSVGDVRTASEPEYQQMDHSKLVPLLVKTIQELEARIAVLEG